MAPNWVANVVGINRVFFHGGLKDGKVIHMNLLQGIKKFYKKDDIFLLQETLHELEKFDILLALAIPSTSRNW